MQYANVPMMHFSQSSASSQVSDSRWEGDMSVAINHNNELLRKGGLVARNCVDIASSKMIKNCDEDSTIGVSKVVLWFLYPRPRPIPERDMSRFMEHPAHYSRTCEERRKSMAGPAQRL